jgi:hypothetical protein
LEVEDIFDTSDFFFLLRWFVYTDLRSSLKLLSKVAVVRDPTSELEKESPRGLLVVAKTGLVEFSLKTVPMR